MTGIELFIVIGGCYAIYQVGMAICTELDYRATIDRHKRDMDSTGIYEGE